MMQKFIIYHPFATRRVPLGCLLLLAVWLVACDVESPAAAQPLPPLITQPPEPAAFENLEKLRAAEIPARDLLDLARRFKGVAELNSAAIGREQPGDVAEFWFKNKENDTNQRVQARLAYQSDALNLWVQEGVTADPEVLRAAAGRLENDILPTTRAFFGREPRPGVDADDRLNILHLKQIGGGVVGYFSAADGFVTAVDPYSNQRQILYVGLDQAPIGEEKYFELVAHEFQHMVQWNNDQNEATWLNEGLSELSVQVNGFDGYVTRQYKTGFLEQPDTQLNAFAYGRADYGAAYLFMAYFLERLGPQATQQLARHPESGVASVAQILAEWEAAPTFDELFADWVVANYLESAGLGQGIYQYRNVSLSEEIAAVEAPAGARQLAGVHQYGADYVRLAGSEPVTFVFTGTQQTRLIDTEPHSGRYFWTSVPADASDVHLTRAFDLTALDVPTAMLAFWTWYEIELGWDYAYAAVSEDDGQTWTTLQTLATNEANPQGNNLGRGLTGTSGSVEPPVWQKQTADLTPYVGREILIRFEYVTDDAVYKQGLALDDIAIPALGYHHDAEKDAGGWEAVGFVRHTNALPQTFITQLLVIAADGTATVTPLPLDAGRRGRWEIPLNDDVKEAIIIISGNNPVTSQIATYAYKIE